jgi:hypothetical protein
MQCISNVNVADGENFESFEIKERTNKFIQKIYDNSSISLAPEDI